MEQFVRRTWAEIDLDALTYNYETLKKHIGENVKFMGIVKADAYGHGSVQVSRCLEEKKALNDLPLEVFREYSGAFGEDIYHSLEPETCVTLRDIPGGPAPRQVQAAIDAGRDALGQYELSREDEHHAE